MPKKKIGIFGGTWKHLIRSTRDIWKSQLKLQRNLTRSSSCQLYVITTGLTQESCLLLTKRLQSLQRWFQMRLWTLQLTALKKIKTVSGAQSTQLNISKSCTLMMSCILSLVKTHTKTFQLGSDMKTFSLWQLWWLFSVEMTAEMILKKTFLVKSFTLVKTS